MVCFSRLLSKAYESLFSVTATLCPTELSYSVIGAVSDDLERWRVSIPEPFRPGTPFQAAYLQGHLSMAVALRIRYHYYSTVIALCRLYLQVSAETRSVRQSESRKTLMNAAREIIELTRHIDTEPYTPIW